MKLLKNSNKSKEKTNNILAETAMPKLTLYDKHGRELTHTLQTGHIAILGAHDTDIGYMAAKVRQAYAECNQAIAIKDASSLSRSFNFVQNNLADAEPIIIQCNLSRVIAELINNYVERCNTVIILPFRETDMFSLSSLTKQTPAFKLLACGLTDQVTILGPISALNEFDLPVSITNLSEDEVVIMDDEQVVYALTKLPTNPNKQNY